MELLWPKYESVLQAFFFFFFCGMLLLNRLRNHALRAGLRVVGGCGLVLLPFALLLVGCEVNGYTHSALMPSPDGKYVARAIVWRGSALDTPQGIVILRRPGHLNWTTVYNGIWWSDADGHRDPHVIWKTSNELEIVSPDGFGTCKPEAGSIRVACTVSDRNN